MVSGSSIADENYTLKYSAGGSEGVFQWLGLPDGRTPIIADSSRKSIVSSATASQLQMRQAGQSDSGLYSCNATVGGLTLSSELEEVGVNGAINTTNM